ncbi:MAG: aminotransferase class III-fold pyridoxal phosphate-dependent enzyme [Dehalococcoidia bacterium]|nr:aminotransferase class III-fold pyridoxal phosphate-dependent enzyme [Dehalococcoidia bacterium]
MDTLRDRYVRTHAGSVALHEEAVRYFAAGGATHVVRMSDPCRPYITHARGSHKWDVDGNEYIDYTMGHGALILGHSHPDVVSAVGEQAERGFHFGDNHELEVRWAALISQMMPLAEHVEFCASGQEGNMIAIRLARLHTGRRRILRFTHCYHGWADELSAVGAPGCENECVTSVPLNDLMAVERELETGEYALLMSEGGGAHMAGRLPIDLDFQRTLPDLAHKYETLYCIDEVVTGFREAPGGWQELVGVTPDLTTIGKCVGGGLPVGALVGKAELFDALRPDSVPGKTVRHAGTWNANPLAAAAGVAACSLYLRGEPQRQAKDMAHRFRDGANEVFRIAGISGQLYGRSVVHLYLGRMRDDSFDHDFEAPSTSVSEIEGTRFNDVTERLSLHLLQRGVAALGGSIFVFSAAHTVDDVTRTLHALEDSLRDMVAEGTIPRELRLD